MYTFLKPNDLDNQEMIAETRSYILFIKVIPLYSNLDIFTTSNNTVCLKPTQVSQSNPSI